MNISQERIIKTIEEFQEGEEITDTEAFELIWKEFEKFQEDSETDNNALIFKYNDF